MTSYKSYIQQMENITSHSLLQTFWSGSLLFDLLLQTNSEYLTYIFIRLPHTHQKTETILDKRQTAIKFCLMHRHNQTLHSVHALSALLSHSCLFCFPGVQFPEEFANKMEDDTY